MGSSGSVRRYSVLPDRDVLYAEPRRYDLPGVEENDGNLHIEQVAEEALTQIDENGYSQRFAVSGKKMYKVALVFSSEGKGLLGWKVKE